MKLLKQTALRAKEDKRLEDIVVLHINHCVDNTFSFNDVLRSLFEQVVLITPPYSNQSIPNDYKGSCYHGIKQDGAYHLMKNNVEFKVADNDFMDATLFLLEEAFCIDLIPLLKSGKKLLIIEDGGYHFEVLSRVKKMFPDVEDKIIGVVEQTTSGTRRSMSLQGYRYSYPCASVARSDVKMNLESIFIGQRIVEELGQILYELDAFFSFHTVLLVGYGIIGRSCKKALDGHYCKIEAYDTNKDILEVANNDGLKTYAEPSIEMFSNDTIVIGCVGRPSFNKEMFLAFLNGEATNIYLASGSSKDVEFSWLLHYLSDNKNDIDGLILEKQEVDKWHTCYRFSYQGIEKNVYIIAEGKPVNFYRDGVISLTYRVIDLVFTEMLKMALYLCENRNLTPKLYILGEKNPISDAVNEEQLLKQWFLENRFWYQGSLKDFLSPHPRAEKLRKITWEIDNGEDY